MKTATICEMEKVIINFLKQNGGYRNGYNTQITAHFSKHVCTTAKWSVPGIGALTLREINRIGNKLVSDLIECIPVGDDCEYSITSVYISDGCFDIEIQRTEKHKIDLYKL